MSIEFATRTEITQPLVDTYRRVLVVTRPMRRSTLSLACACCVGRTMRLGENTAGPALLAGVIG